MIDKKSSRRTFLKASALGAAAAWAAPAVSWAAPAVVRKRPPNLLFINVDQLSINALPQFGCTQVKTPNIDRLARRGTSFELSHCADPLCCPSRACWFTGRAPTEHGVVYNGDEQCAFVMRPEVPDLGAWLRNAGYETFYAGKWHVIGRRVEQSFKVFLEHYNLGEHNDAPIARACETFLSSRSAGAPFFLVAGMLNPHDVCGWLPRWTPGEPLPYPQIAGQLAPLPANHDHFDSREPEFFIAHVRRPLTRRVETWTDPLWRYYAWSYYRLVEMVDACVGRILDALETSPHADNTVVVFSSDHGDAIGRHRLMAKNNFYDNAIRVPLIVFSPGQAAENRTDRTHLASGFDLVPTLCDYAGVAPPPLQRGLSLRPLIEDRNVSWRDHLISHNYIVGRMVRTQRYKYVAYQGDKTDQLFDLVSDPGETKNLATETAAAGPLADHRRMLADWEKSLHPVSEPPGGWLNALDPSARQKKKNARKRPVA